MNCWAKYFFL